MGLGDTPIGVKLGVSFSLLILSVGFLGYIAIKDMKALSGLTEKLYQHPFSVSTASLRIGTNMIKMHRSMKDVALASNAEELEGAVMVVDALEKTVLNDFELVHERFLGDPKQIEAAREMFKKWKPIRDRVITLTRNSEKEQAAHITKYEGAQYVQQLESTINAFILFAQNKADTFAKNARDQSAKEIENVYLIIAMALILGVLLAVVIPPSITKPLRQAMDLAESMASGDFSKRLALNRKDEIGNLSESLDHMVAQLASIIAQIAEGANTLAASISEISATVTQLAASSSETSSSISQITATMEEVKQTALLSNEKAMDVSNRSDMVAHTAEEGTSATEETTTGMNSIREEMAGIAEDIVTLSEQTQNIGEIIDAVNDLADQTNLLSVNASIEAAKAGEHGKGFAVVAQEIKSLSDQSKEATHQIKTILNEIQKATSAAVMAAERGSKAVAQGVLLSEKAGSAILALTRSVDESSQAADQIAASSQQQLVGMDQLVDAMESIKDASHQNVDGARQLEGSVNGLLDLGGEMKDLTTKFKV